MIRAISRPVEVVPERLERVEVGVRPEQPQPRPLHRGRQPCLGGGALFAGLGESGGEGDRELHLGLPEFLDHRERVADQQHRQIDLLGQVRDGRGAGAAEDGLPGGVDRVQACPDPLGPGDQLPGDAGTGPALGVGCPDDGDGLGPEEPVQVGHGRVQRAAADVEIAFRGGGRHAVDGGVRLLAAGHHPGAEVCGEGAVSRSKHRSAHSC